MGGLHPHYREAQSPVQSCWLCYTESSELSSLVGAPLLFFCTILKMADALMMEAASTSETSVNLYQTARHHIPEDSHLHTRRCENLKSYLFDFGVTLNHAIW
jgi:hypothetical protein